MRANQRYRIIWVGSGLDLIFSAITIVTVIFIPLAIVTMVQNFEIIGED